MSDPVIYLLFFGFLLFLLGLYQLLSYRNLLRLALGVEILAKGVTLLFLAAGVHQGNLALLQSLLITFLLVETVLAVLLLALVLLAYRLHGSLDIRRLTRLRG